MPMKALQAPHAGHTSIDSREWCSMPVSHTSQKYSASVGFLRDSWFSWALTAAMVVGSTCFSTCIRYRCNTLFLLDLALTEMKPSRLGNAAPWGPPSSTSRVEEYSLMKGTALRTYSISSAATSSPRPARSANSRSLSVYRDSSVPAMGGEAWRCQRRGTHPV